MDARTGGSMALRCVQRRSRVRGVGERSHRAQLDVEPPPTAYCWTASSAQAAPCSAPPVRIGALENVADSSRGLCVSPEPNLVGWHDH